MAMIRCTACGYQIPADAFRGDAPVLCPMCRRQVNAVVLPAIARSGVQPPVLPPTPPGPGEAACFYDPQRKATETCGHCGVFMSSAWAAKWGRDTVCLKCLEELRVRRKDPRFESRRLLWDNAAFTLAVLPFALCVPFLLLGPLALVPVAMISMSSMVTAPMAVGLALVHWNKPRSLVPRGRWRLVVGIILGLLQCAAWTALIIAVVSQRLSLDSAIEIETPPSPEPP